MHKIDGKNATEDGQFQEYDPATGQGATYLTAEWLNAVQGELMAFLEDRGVDPDKDDSAQVYKIVLDMFQSGLTGGAPVYASTAQGLSATPEGGYFSVPSGEPGESLILYRHDSGGVATEVARTPSSYGVLTAEAAAVAASGVAEAQADRSEAEADRSEAARDAAQLSAGVFPDAATGLSSTSDGGYFSVPDGDEDDFLTLYRNESGAAVAVETYPSAAAIRKRVLAVPDIAALRALTGVQDGQAVRMTTTGRAGDFYFNASDLSAEVVADPLSGIYVAPDSDPTGASGAFVRDVSDFIAPEFFGVDGSASASDKSAWSEFFSYHAESGIPGRCLSRLYLFDPDSNGVVRAGVGDGQSVDFDGNGATFRFVDGMSSVSGAFWNMVIFASGGPYSPPGATVEKIHVRNVVLDGNMRGQPTPAVPSDYEQRASMKVFMDASDGNRCKDVWFHNVTQIDPMADTLQFGPSTAGTVNGEASINNLTISKFHAGVRTGVRAAIQIGSQCGRINISDVTKDEPTGSERNSIETEFSVMGPQKVTLNMSNVHIDDVELGCPPGNEDRFIINMSNVVTDGFFACIGGSVYANNCALRISLSAAQRIKYFLCSNTRFIHAIRGDTGGPYSLSVVAISGGTHWQFSNVRHVCEGAVDPSAGEPLFNTGNIDASEIDDHVFEMSNVWYDPACPTGIDCYAGGTLRTRGCTMGGFDRGVLCGGFSSFGSNWYSDGDDFTQVTGDKFRIAGGANSSVVIGTQVTDSLEFATTGATQDIITSSGRSIQVSAAPSGGGAVGDRAVLGPSEYDSATSGDPVSWVCVRSNPSSAGWVAALQKP